MRTNEKLLRAHSRSQIEDETRKIEKNKDNRHNETTSNPPDVSKVRV
ncbi:hypothetical protein THOM_2835 [Trachipleistophora hominis]|uniref:Uncharacterized protein n=1 Tax=Trachipleistophora hominis TaxID=72359 RepID=L7JS15_TRAHO|nr:hypothetical protein THOM_2835 [Trachipleistophora hominis]